MNPITVSVLLFLFGIAISITGYFLRGVICELKETRFKVDVTKSELDLLKNDYHNKIEIINEKITDLKNAIVDLTNELKKINFKNG